MQRQRSLRDGRSRSIRDRPMPMRSSPYAPIALHGTGSQRKRYSGKPSDRNAEAAVAARRAVALDPGSADANAVLAVCAHRVARDWLAAEALFRQAIALAPDSATGHAAIGFALTTRGRRDEAADHLRIARDLDPLNIGLRVGAGRA